MWKNFDTKKFSCIVQVETGKIIAYEKSPRISRRKIETNIKNETNIFPHTDEDYIILSGRKIVESVER